MKINKYTNEFNDRKAKSTDGTKNWLFENSIKQTDLWIS